MGSAGFNEVIHAPNRLRICAILANVAEAEFATLRDTLEVADSVLSKHLKVLVAAGYVNLAKPRRDAGRARTWARLTPEGRKAFDAHLAELQALVSGTTTAPGAKARSRARGASAIRAV